MREVVPGVLMWSWFAEHKGYDFNGYLVRHVEGNVCVDPAEPTDDILDALAREGVARIVLTNRNHYRAAQRLKERTGARVAIHPADAAFVRDKGVVVDDALRAGDRVGPFVVLDASGKSPGEIALYWPERRLLLVGDACIGHPPGRLSLLPENVIDDPAALRATLRRLAAEIDFDTLLFGDGAPLFAGARAALEELIRRSTP